VFGALPASYLGFPAGIGILLGFFLFNQGWLNLAMLCAGVFGWTGMVSLWVAARSRPAIGKRTAIGLLLGLIAAVLYAGLYWGNYDVSHRLSIWPPILLAGPVGIALTHLNRFRKTMGTPGAETPVRAPALPPSEASTRRVGRFLKILLFVQVLTFGTIGATLLGGGSGAEWGALFTIILGFPFALGVASFCVWAFVRHRRCRAWAAVVFFAPVALFAFLQLNVKLFGEPAVTTFCRYAAPLLPVAAFLVFPRTFDRIIPRLLCRRALCITYVAVQSAMLLAWVVLLAGWAPWKLQEKDPTAVAFVLILTALSAATGLPGLLFSYLGLFRKREERFLWLSIPHLILSFLLLVIVGAVLLVMGIMLTPLG
jgi:hypothetical protein